MFVCNCLLNLLSISEQKLILHQISAIVSDIFKFEKTRLHKIYFKDKFNRIGKHGVKIINSLKRLSLQTQHFNNVIYFKLIIILSNFYSHLLEN